MPVTTTDSDNPPQVDIKVTNGGGGGADHFVGAFVTWNPAILDASSPDPNSNVVFKKNEGFCVWHGKTIASNTSKIFSLTFRRKSGGTTCVLSCTLDPVTGAYSNIDKWDVPLDHPMVSSASASKKKTSKKKTKKRARK